jgi:hypothetical protein
MIPDERIQTKDSEQTATAVPIPAELESSPSLLAAALVQLIVLLVLLVVMLAAWFVANAAAHYSVDLQVPIYCTKNLQMDSKLWLDLVVVRVIHALLSSLVLAVLTEQMKEHTEHPWLKHQWS